MWPNDPQGDVNKGMPELDLLVGIASFGNGTECEGGDPSVYMRAARFLPWIRAVIEVTFCGVPANVLLRDTCTCDTHLGGICNFVNPWMKTMIVS